MSSGGGDNEPVAAHISAAGSTKQICTADDDGSPPAHAHSGLGGRHAFGDVAPQAELAFAGGEPFTVCGTPIARDAIAVQAGIDMGIGEKASLGVCDDGQLAARASDHGASINLPVRF